MNRAHISHVLLAGVILGRAVGPASITAEEPKPKSILRGHEYRVWSVAFSPDGKALASAGYDDSAIVWNVATGEKVSSLSANEHEARSIAYSPDGRTVATASIRDDTVRLWEAATGKHLLSHQFSASSVAFSPDGKTLAAGGYVDENAGCVKLWDVATGKERATLTLPKRSVHSIAFSPDGKLMASGIADGGVVVWDLPTARQTATLTSPVRPARSLAFAASSVAFSPDGKTLASGDRFGVITLWDMATNNARVTIRGPEKGVGSVAFSPNGATLVVSGFDGTLRFCDTATGKVRTNVDGQVGAIYTVAFAPDGKTLAIGGDGPTIKLWDLATLAHNFQPGDDRIKNRLRSNNYSVAWGNPARFGPEAELEIGDGVGHPPADFAWLRFRPVKDGVDVLVVEFVGGREPYKSRWAPDRLKVAVRKARMTTDAYVALLRELAIVDSAKLNPPEHRSGGSSSADFWAQARLSAGKRLLLDLDWAGYVSDSNEVKYAKVVAAADVARVAVHWLDFQDHALTDEERAWASTKFVRDWKRFKNEEFHGWVRERYIQMIGLVGDKSALPTLRDILARDPPKDRPRDPSDERCVYYAINAVTRQTNRDVRDRPVEEMDIEKTRRKVLDLLRDLK